jgi:AraC-like DNA-binding protein
MINYNLKHWEDTIIVNCFNNNKESTILELSEMLGLSTRQLSRHMNRLGLNTQRCLKIRKISHKLKKNKLNELNK